MTSRILRSLDALGFLGEFSIVPVGPSLRYSQVYSQFHLEKKQISPREKFAKNFDFIYGLGDGEKIVLTQMETSIKCNA